MKKMLLDPVYWAVGMGSSVAVTTAALILGITPAGSLFWGWVSIVMCIVTGIRAERRADK